MHGDTSPCVVVADSSTISVHDNVKGLSGLDLSDYEFISCTKDGSIAAVVKPVEDRLTYHI